MFDWLYHNREEFLLSYVEIGHSYHMSKDLQKSHTQFTVACQVIFPHSYIKLINMQLCLMATPPPLCPLRWGMWMPDKGGDYREQVYFEIFKSRQ